MIRTGPARIVPCYELRQGEPYVAGRHVAWRTLVVNDQWEYPVDIGLPAFRHRGFHVPFENGLVLSSQWGTGNYCDNYTGLLRAPVFTEASVTAELACWWDAGDGGRGDEPMLEWPDGDSVRGYVPASVWWDLVDALARVPRGAVCVGRRVQEVFDAEEPDVSPLPEG